MNRSTISSVVRRSAPAGCSTITSFAFALALALGLGLAMSASRSAHAQPAHFEFSDGPGPYFGWAYDPTPLPPDSWLFDFDGPALRLSKPAATGGGGSYASYGWIGHSFPGDFALTIDCRLNAFPPPVTDGVNYVELEFRRLDSNIWFSVGRRRSTTYDRLEAFCWQVGGGPGSVGRLDVPPGLQDGMRLRIVRTGPTCAAYFAPLESEEFEELGAWDFEGLFPSSTFGFYVGEGIDSGPNLAFDVEFDNCMIDGNIPTAVEPALLPSVKAQLAVWPNPAVAGSEVRFTSPVPLGATCSIFDASGRIVRRLELDASAAAARGRETNTFRWDGLDATGRSAPAGVYHAWVDGGAGAGAGVGAGAGAGASGVPSSGASARVVLTR